MSKKLDKHEQNEQPAGPKMVDWPKWNSSIYEYDWSKEHAVAQNTLARICEALGFEKSEDLNLDLFISFFCVKAMSVDRDAFFAKLQTAILPRQEIEGLITYLSGFNVEHLSKHLHRFGDLSKRYKFKASKNGEFKITRNPRTIKEIHDKMWEGKEGRDLQRMDFGPYKHALRQKYVDFAAGKFELTRDDHERFYQQELHKTEDWEYGSHRYVPDGLKDWEFETKEHHDAYWQDEYKEWAEFDSERWTYEQHKIEENEREMFGKFDSIPPRPEFKLEEKIYSNAGRHSNGLRMQIPKNAPYDGEGRYGYGGGHYFTHYGHRMLRDIDREYVPAMIERYKGRLDSNHFARRGSVLLPQGAQDIARKVNNIKRAMKINESLNVPLSFTEASKKDLENLYAELAGKITGQEIQIRNGIRRVPRPPEKEIAMGLYLYDNDPDCQAWCASLMRSRLIRDCISPHFLNDKTDDPFDWAHKRTSVILGHAVEMGMHEDYPAGKAQWAPRMMAPIVCNSLPTDLLRPRSFEMTPKNVELYVAAMANFSEALPPETVCLLMELSELIDPAWLEDKEVIKLFLLMPRCIENGLVIDRVKDLFIMQTKNGMGVKEAFLFALKTVTDVFSGEEEPWWFKEDFSLCKVFDTKKSRAKTGSDDFKILCDDEGREIVSKVAAEMGFGFTYGVAVFKKMGHKIETVCGFPRSEALRLTCEMTTLYGIGNIQRACNVIDFAVAHLMEVPPKHRARSLELFESHVKRVAPHSKILGRMEGEESNFDVPGLGALLVWAVGEEKAKKDPFDDLTMTPKRIRKVVKPLSAPLIERARTLPALNVSYDQTRLLATSLPEESRRFLPIPEESTAVSKPIKTPLNDIFAYYQRIREECGGLDEKVSGTYLAMFARKMRNPFDPPKGFLRFLQKYDDIPDPEYMEALNERLFAGPTLSHHHTERIQKAVVDRIFILSNLVDTFVMGMLSEEDLMSVLNWMVEDPKENIKVLARRKAEEELVEQKAAVERMLKSADPEERECAHPFTAEDEEHFIEYRTREYIERSGHKDVWHERLKIIEHRMSLIMAVNTLAIVKFFSPAFVSDFVHKYVQSWLHGDPFEYEEKFSQMNLLNPEEYEKVLGKMKKMAGLDIFDTEKFEEAFRSSESIEDHAAFIQNLIVCVKIFDESIDAIKEAEGYLCKLVEGYNYRSSFEGDRSGPENITREAIEIFDKLETALLAAWENVALVKPNVVGTLLSKEFTAGTWIQVFTMVRDFNNQALATTGTDDSGGG